jgi:pilus assembly protein CpaB
MQRIRILMVLVLALAAGGVLAVGTYNYVQKSPVQAAALPTTQVVVAAADLDIGAELRREDIRLIEWPASSLPANAMTNPDDVIGRGLVLPVIQNEPILPMKLASKEAGAGLPPVIPPGQRAVSVRVNEVIGVAGYVVPGTRVDVVATVSPTQNQVDMTSKVILTDVAVLAAGTKIERDTEKDKPVAVNVVTLLVTPDESERLTLAANEGKIQLALRNPLDKESPKTLGIRPAALLGTAAPARPQPRALPSRTVEKVAAVAPAPEPTTVEIIRGDKRAHEVVRQEQ